MKEQQAPNHGKNKSKVINPASHELHRDLKEYARENQMDIVTDAVKLLGTPMGPDSGRITAMALDTVTKHNPFFEALADPKYQDPWPDDCFA